MADRGIVGTIGGLVNQFENNAGATGMNQQQQGAGGGLQGQILHQVEGMMAGHGNQGGMGAQLGGLMGQQGATSSAGAGGLGAQLGGLMGQHNGASAGGNPVNTFIQHQMQNQLEDRVEGMLPGDYGQRLENILHPQQGTAVPSGGVPQQVGNGAPTAAATEHHGAGGVLGAIKKILH